MGLPVDGRGGFGVHFLMAAHIGAHAGLPLVSTLCQRQHLAGRIAVGQDLAFNDQFAGFHSDAVGLPKDGTEVVVVTQDDRQFLLERHSGQIDHDRLTAPALTDLRTRIGFDRKPLWRCGSIAISGRQERHASIQRDFVHSAKLPDGVDVVRIVIANPSHASAPCGLPFSSSVPP
jgi:hypothetical protein